MWGLSWFSLFYKQVTKTTSQKQQIWALLLQSKGVWSKMAWTEEQMPQALNPDQKMFIMDLKTDQVTSHTYALLEWRRRIPACFQGVSLQITSEAKANLIQLRVPDTSMV